MLEVLNAHFKTTPFLVYIHFSVQRLWKEETLLLWKDPFFCGRIVPSVDEFQTFISRCGIWVHMEMSLRCRNWCVMWNQLCCCRSLSLLDGLQTSYRHILGRCASCMDVWSTARPDGADPTPHTSAPGFPQGWLDITFPYPILQLGVSADTDINLIPSFLLC